MTSNWSRWFVCQLLEERCPEPLLERFLRELDGSWQNDMAVAVLQKFLDRRLHRGETIEAAWLLPPEGVQASPDSFRGQEHWNKLEFVCSILEIESRSSHSHPA